MTTQPHTTDERLLRALAVAVVQQPRATLHDLARAANVSKATLHRFFRTREQLIETLRNYCVTLMGQLLEDANLATAEPLAALRQLIGSHLAHKEFSSFLIYHWKPESSSVEESKDVWKEHEASMDAFFLRGQQEGAFRIDISAPCMTDAFAHLLCGMVEGERQGRLARAGLAQAMEQLFLHGVQAPETRSTS